MRKGRHSKWPTKRPEVRQILADKNLESVQREGGWSRKRAMLHCLVCNAMWKIRVPRGEGGWRKIKCACANRSAYVSDLGGESVGGLRGTEDMMVRELLLRGYRMSDITVTGTGSKFFIKYSTTSGFRKYFPDALLEDDQVLVESKDWGSSGLSGRGLYDKTADELWESLRDKHRGCASAGYELLLIVFRSGRRTRLPAGWEDMTREEAAQATVAFGSPMKRRKIVTREAIFESIPVVAPRPVIEGWPKYRQLCKARPLRR